MRKAQRIVIAGCGPGSPAYLGPAVREAAGQAEVLVGAKRLLELFPESPAERIEVGADVEGVLKEIEKRRGLKRIVVLVTGDPGLCSLARPVMKRFGREACRVIPGVSSVQAAFASIGLDWLGAKIIDAHGEDPPPESAEPEALGQEGKIAVLAGRRDSCRWISRLAGALGKSHRAFICEDLTLPEERVREAADLSEQALSRLNLSSRTIVLFIMEDLLA